MGDKNETIKLNHAREFCQSVRKLAEEYDVPFFVVTDGASATSNNGCEAVAEARNHQIEWETNHGFDPKHDWGNDNYIEFSEDEIDYLHNRIDNNQKIYMIRGLSEVGKYKKDRVYDSVFGNLKVISVNHYSIMDKQPFLEEINNKQIDELKSTLDEDGFDIIELVRA